MSLAAKRSGRAGARAAAPQDAAEIVQVVAVRLGGALFGIDVTRVCEIVRTGLAARRAGLPAFVRGLVHVGGEVAPVVDLRMHLGLPHVEGDLDSPILLTTLQKQTIGFMVDAADDVVRVHRDQIDRGHAAAAHGLNRACIQGAFKSAAGRLLLLNIDAILSSAEMTDLAGIVG